MNKLRSLFVMLVLLALALLPLQTAQAQGLALPDRDGGRDHRLQLCAERR